MIRAVLDTNVLISALITSDGAPATLLRQWQQGAFELVVSEKLLTELQEVLERPKLRRYVTTEEAREYTDMLRARAIVGDAPSAAGISTDPADDHVIALALSAAVVLVTGDSQMLQLRVPDLGMLTPRAFLDALEQPA